MKVDEFLVLMQKVKRFQLRLEQENIVGEHADKILKIYINDLTDKINTEYLKVV